MLDHTIFIELQQYIEQHLEVSIFKEIEAVYSEDLIESSMSKETLDHFIQLHRQPSLNQLLFSYIDRTGETDADIYNRAGIDRKLFSKIRINPNYHPRKNTILALALALKLDTDDTENLLSTAGYSLSNSETSDLIIQFCIKKKIYNIHDVNEALHRYNEKPLI